MLYKISKVSFLCRNPFKRETITNSTGQVYNNNVYYMVHSEVTQGDIIKYGI